MSRLGRIHRKASNTGMPWKGNQMHSPKEQLPVVMEGPGMSVRAAEDWGGMAAVVFELPAGTDLGPMLEGLPDDACICSHWGYVLKGKVSVRNVDGTQEVLEAGQLFHILPGHTPVVQEDAEFVEFTPTAQFKKVISHVLEKAAAAT